MLGYHLRHAARGLRRTPLLSWTMAIGLGIGIAGSTTAYSINVGFSGCPVPERLDTLHQVTIARHPKPITAHPYAYQLMRFSDWHLPYQDARRVLDASAPGLRTATFSAPLFLGGQGEPVRQRSRFCTRDFFAMFGAPFLAGSPWTAEEDRAGAPVAVLSRQLADRFGGPGAVGHTITIQGQPVRVAGVLGEWGPTPRFWDFAAYNFPIEELYVPFESLRAFEPIPDALFRGVPKVARYDDLYASDESFVQVWIDAPDAPTLGAWRAELGSHVGAQISRARFPPATRLELSALRVWLATAFDVPMQGQFYQLLSNVLLFAASLSLIRLLLAKFLARASEVAVHRALGAGRGAIFLRHVLEAEMLAVAGGVLGYLGTVGSFALFYWVATDYHIRFVTDLRAAAAALATALLAGLVVGIYPAWRICQAPPVTFLGRS